MKKHSNKQTAYEFNSHASELNSSIKDHGWASPINRMIDQRYAFLNLSYANQGYLFRGMSSGIFNAILEKQFWHSPLDNEGLEQELDIVFASQDVSDALTVTRLWEGSYDKCILVIKASLFNEELLKKRAAIMATAEPGVIFKYPFFTSPISIDDVDYIIFHPEYLKQLDKYFADEIKCRKLKLELERLYSKNKIIMPESLEAELNNRKGFENSIHSLFNKHCISAAKVIESGIKPLRRT